VAAGQAVTLWLTQRILNLLLPTLFNWLESKTNDSLFSEAKIEMSQQVATSQLEQLTPVRPDAQCLEFLVHSVDLTTVKSCVSIVFKDEKGAELALLQLQTKQLRQWLAIVYRQYTKANWPTDTWPTWIGPGDSVTKLPNKLFH
jgi:hypothetical protein